PERIVNRLALAADRIFIAGGKIELADFFERRIGYIGGNAAIIDLRRYRNGTLQLETLDLRRDARGVGMADLRQGHRSAATGGEVTGIQRGNRLASVQWQANGDRIISPFGIAERACAPSA